MQQIHARLTDEQAQRLARVKYWSRARSLNALIVSALEDKMRELEKGLNKGKPFAPIPEQEAGGVVPGRVS